MVKFRSRSAFTLIELLVVIAIIGVLVGLLLPAVQSAREAARRMQCQNKLKQLTVALANYTDSAGRFPPGHVWMSTAAVPTSGQGRGASWGASWALMLLPYMDKQAIYDKYNFQLTSRTPENSTVNLMQISDFLCPSQSVPTTPLTQDYNGHAKMHLAANFGPGQQLDLGDFTTQSQRGPFSAVAQWGAAPEDIADGTSKTVALSEIMALTTVSYDGRGAWNYVVGLSFCGDDGQLTPNSLILDEPPYCINSATVAPPCSSDNTGSSSVQGARSVHPGGVHVSFCDGAVSFISDSVDSTVWDAALGISDNQIAEGL
ncbi:Type II secretion system protein G precursor [Planctomycetes bacterium Pan216]|uniref:Type II secretion system protein G n=1 Tax=Kolteria novifilia TaxID=2527975 RepID=A0A518B0K0_9BACT|nr:Type II secretion system protein G precursor [Planctomycetes bacterium Pan216]